MSQSANPLNILATIGLFAAYFLGGGMLYGFYSTKTYPTAIGFVLIASLSFIWITFQLLRKAISTQQHTHKILAVTLSVFFSFMILIPMKLKPDLHANPLVTQTIYHYIELCYFGLLLALSLCMQALRLKSDIDINKNNIPWSVDLAGLMAMIVSLSFTSKYFVLYFLNIPMFNGLGYTLLFFSISMIIFTTQYFGKYGPFYRSAHGQQIFLTFSCTLLLVSILHSIGPFLRELAYVYHFTDHQFTITLTINRITAVIEIIACATIFYCMRQLATIQYYYDLSHTLNETVDSKGKKRII